MYIQSLFLENRASELNKLMREYPLGTMIMNGAAGLEANHLPLLLDADKSILTAHLPLANPIWKTIGDAQVLVIFQGPNSYISPSSYPGKAAHGKAVPTWNYAVVHVYGIARIIDDKVWLRTHLDAMTHSQEGSREHPWKVSDAPADYIEKLLTHIIGLEISIVRIEGKFKVAQNRTPEDRRGVIETLEKSDAALAQLHRERFTP